MEIRNDGVVLVKFGATWCGPCKMMDRILVSVANKYESDANVMIMSVDIDQNQEMAKEYNVTAVPTMLFFKNATQFERFEGIKSEQNIIDVIESRK
jgi:thioredoxin 1